MPAARKRMRRKKMKGKRSRPCFLCKISRFTYFLRIFARKSQKTAEKMHHMGIFI